MGNFKPKGYVIYSEEHKEELSHFYLQENTEFYLPIPIINEHRLASFNDISMFFDQNGFDRIIKLSEIAYALTHIQCWKNIANDEEINDNEFVIISDARIEFAKNYIPALEQFINKYSYSQYHILQAQCSNLKETHWRDKLYSGEELSGIVFNIARPYDNVGAELYAIRKSKAVEICKKLDSNKPNWLAGEFSKFCNIENILRTSSMLGQIPKEKLLPKKHSVVKNPLFSIIIPIYNVEKYLSYAVESVLAQDFENYEIILINDGSSDTSEKIAYDYSQKYNHITFVNKPNSGVSVCRNIGIKVASGDYIVWLDSDDYWNGTTILSDLAKIINDDNPDVIINFSSSVYGEDIISHKVDISNLTISGDFWKDVDFLLEKNIYVGFPWAKIVKRSILEEHNLYFIKDRYYEDAAWSFDLIKYLRKYSIYNSNFYMYRRERQGSITRYISIENQISLFNNCIEKTKMMQILKNRYPRIYPAHQKYLSDMYDYAERCYALFGDKDKETLKEARAQFDYYKESNW